MLDYIVKLSIDSGGLLPLMALLLLVALVIIIERMYYFNWVIRAGLAMEDAVQRVRFGDRQGLEAVATRYVAAPQAQVVAVGLHSQAQSAEELDRHMEESVMWQLPKLDRMLWILDTTVTLAPLLGLFGTIIGMIDTFDVLGNSKDPNAVTGGIAHALIATGSGLLIAIITVVFLNYFNKRVRLAMHQMELLKTMVINRLHGRGVAGQIAYGAEESPKVPNTPVVDKAQAAMI